jgi:hypothetical protein
LFLGIAADIIEPGGPDELIGLSGDRFGVLHSEKGGLAEKNRLTHLFVKCEYVQRIPQKHTKVTKR